MILMFYDVILKEQFLADETYRGLSPTATNVSDMSVFREARDLFSDDTVSRNGSKEKSFDDSELRVCSWQQIFV